jgi:antitoxin component of MazEF toxin-antitoxin module
MANWFAWINSKIIYKKDGFIIREKKNGDWIVQFSKEVLKNMNLYPGKEVNITSNNNMIIVESVDK